MMQHSHFTHLHLHTYFSLLDGAVPISALAQKARKLKFPAIAITDHGNLFGAIEFYKQMMAAGIKPIIGCEMYLLTDGNRSERQTTPSALRHLTLLVKNKAGYQNLCRLITSSYLEGFYYKPRIDKEILAQHNEGLVALSGCLKGEIAKLFFDGRDEDATKAAEFMAGIFGDRFYLEIQDQGLPGQKEVNEALIALGRKKGIPLVATNDVHFLEVSDYEAQDALLCIQTGNMVAETERLKLGSDQFYLKSEEEMRQVFPDCPEAIEETCRLAEHLNFEFEFGKYHFPKFTAPEGQDLATYLGDLAWKGLDERWQAISAQGGTRTAYEDRLRKELKTITEMGFAGYFLIVSDFIRYAKSQNLPVGPGRGSAAGSLVAYCLGITNIDPLVHDLLFERFLNPERISMPDMDIDFCMRRRDEVIQYVAKKYGNVSQITTFGTMKAKAVLRDVGRVLGIPYGQVDKIAKLVPATLGMTLEQALEIEPKLKEEEKSSPDVRRLIKLALKLEGFPRHASTHAAGVVISDQKLSEFLPLYLGQNDEVISQFDMKGVELIGLIKFDFLGLKTLTVIDDCIKIVEDTTGKKIDIDAIDLTDPLVYENLSAGNTSGIFQLESSGMTALVTRLKPTLFGDLTALVALFRPGPLGSGMVDDFINRKHGKTPIKYDLPILEDILKDTYGIILYQEQVMHIASKLASFTLGEADILRRAMGKKKPEEMAKQKERFLQGCAKNNIPKAKADRLFELIAKFAEYGFNKSHSAAYALIAYQTAYLKCHFPAQYMAALLTSESTNTDKLVEYIADAKAHKIAVLPPDINESGVVFTVVGDLVIRFGLAAVKNVGEAAVEHIIQVRKDGPFVSLPDFCKRVDSRRVNKRVLESLIKCGAFDFTKNSRAALFESLAMAMEAGSKHQRDKELGQESLFGSLGDVMAEEDKIENKPEWPDAEKLGYEKDSLGFYITGHPLTEFSPVIANFASTECSKILQVKDKSIVRIGGMPARIKEVTTRRGDRMGFVTLEDLKGSVEVVMFSEVYAAAKPLISSNQPLFVTGEADVSDESAKIIAKEVWPLAETPERLTKSIHFHLRQPESTAKHLAQLKTLISQFKGNCPAYLHLISDDETETSMALPPELNLKPCEELKTTVEKVFGHQVVRFNIQ